MQEVPSQSQVIEVAKEFGRIMCEYLSADEMSELNRLNKDVRSDCCESHDYLDSNMVMHSAMYRYHTHFDLNEPFYNTLWNEAWSLAKLNDFYVKK